MKDYLKGYKRRVPRKLNPREPITDDFVTAIGGSNNSAAGYDGIPFSILRACDQPVLHQKQTTPLPMEEASRTERNMPEDTPTR